MSRSVNINMHQVCPIMSSLFDEDIESGRAADLDSNEQSVAELAAAHIATGLLLMEHIGGDLNNILAASKIFAEVFMRAVDETNEQKGFENE